MISNRQQTLRIWGPSGSDETLGTQYMVDRMKETYAWDWASRQGDVNTLGFATEVHEFAYKAVNEDIWPQPSITKKQSANPKDRIGLSDDIWEGRAVFQEVIEQYYNETNEKFGTDYEVPQ